MCKSCLCGFLYNRGEVGKGRILYFPRHHWLRVKTSETCMGYLFLCFWSVGPSQTWQAITIALIALLNLVVTPHTIVRVHGKTKLVPTSKIHSYWIAFIVPLGAMYTARG